MTALSRSPHLHQVSKRDCGNIALLICIPFLFCYWSTIILQWWDSFGCTTNWTSYVYADTPLSWPSTPPSTPLGHHRVLRWAPRATSSFPLLGSLCHVFIQRGNKADYIINLLLYIRRRGKRQEVSDLIFYKIFKNQA